MGESSLERVHSMKYLGVILDDKMSWGPQIDYVRKKLASATSILSKLKYYVDTKTIPILLCHS